MDSVSSAPVTILAPSTPLPIGSLAPLSTQTTDEVAASSGDQASTTATVTAASAVGGGGREELALSNSEAELGAGGTNGESGDSTGLKPRRVGGWRRVLPRRIRRKPELAADDSGEKNSSAATSPSGSASSSWSFGLGRRSREWWATARGQVLGDAPRTFENSSAGSTSRTAMETSVDAPVEAAPVASERTCPVCFDTMPLEEFPELVIACKHRTCQDCLMHYFRQEVLESRTALTCPECAARFDPSDVIAILRHSGQAEVDKYLSFTLRRTLATIPDIRWCPAADCGFGVIAANCASCPKIVCQRPGCNTEFCYHCQYEWHPAQTCDDAQRQRVSNNPNTVLNIEPTDGDERGAARSGGRRKRKEGDLMLKPCPKCRSKIMKANDGSCNHITCCMCGCHFCWLCLREIDDMHFISPSGCTFWGKRTWSRKRTIITQLAFIVGAPLGLAMICVLTPPFVMIAFPAYIVDLASKQKYKSVGRRRLGILTSLLGSVVVSPILAAVGLTIFIPLACFFAYAVIPYQLFKQIFPCVSGEPSPDRFGVHIDEDDSAV